MDFLLVPDASIANETRRAIARRNTIDFTVCTLSVLLEELAISKPCEVKWCVSLQEQAQESAFWLIGGRVDEPATIVERKSDVTFSLNHSPLGVATEATATLANRKECYYVSLNALVRLIKERPEKDLAAIFQALGRLSRILEESLYLLKRKMMLLIIGCLLGE